MASNTVTITISAASSLSSPEENHGLTTAYKVDWAYREGERVCVSGGHYNARRIPSLDDRQAAEVRWYLERHLQEPLETERAADAQRTLVRHGAALSEFLGFPFELERSVAKTATAVIYIDSSTWCDEENVFWEALENRDVWTHGAPSRVLVVRLSPPATHASRPVENSLDGPECINLLIVSARPDVDQDLPPRLVTNVLREVISDTILQSRVTLTLVRPATVEKLKDCLDQHPFGHFNLIHLDLHGVQDDDGRHYLRFLSADPEHGRFGLVPHDVDATRLAQILCEHGVRYAVLNACRSAAVSPADASIALTLLDYGLSGCVAMAVDIIGKSVQIFVKAWYEAYVRQRAPFAWATAIARQAMRDVPERKGRYGYAIPFDDSVVPIVCLADTHSALLQTLGASGERLSPASRFTETQLWPVGRENELLEVESALLIRKMPVLLFGDAAIGKTAIVEELVSWWEATGLFNRTHLLRVENKETSIEQAIHDLCVTCGWSGATKQLAEQVHFLASRNDALVVDELDMLTVPAATIQRSVRRFLLKLTRLAAENSLPLVFASRSSESWLGATIFPVRVSGLGIIGGCELLFSLLDIHHDRASLVFQPTIEESSYMEQLVKLLGGNPLAITLISWGMVSKERSFKAAYLRIVGGKPFQFSDSQSPSQFRCVNELRSLIAETELNAQGLGLSAAFIAPFWRLLRIDDLPLMAWYCIMENLKVSGRNVTERTGSLKQQETSQLPGSSTQEAHDIVEDVIDIDEATVYFDNIDVESLQKDDDILELSHPLNTMLQPLIDALYLRQVPNHGGARDQCNYLTIHPLLSIYLRASRSWKTHQQAFSRAFATYVTLRVQQWPVHLETDNDAWIVPRREAEPEFHNMLAAAVLCLHHCDSAIKFAAFIKDLRWYDVGTLSDASRLTLMSSVWEFAVELLKRQEAALLTMSASQRDQPAMLQLVPWNLMKSSENQLDDERDLSSITNWSTLLFQTRYHLFTYAMRAYTHLGRIQSARRKEYVSIIEQAHRDISAGEIPAHEPTELLRADLNQGLQVVMMAEGRSDVDPEAMWRLLHLRQDRHDAHSGRKTARSSDVSDLPFSTSGTLSNVAHFVPAALQVRRLIDERRLDEARVAVDRAMEQEIHVAGNDLVNKAKLLVLLSEIDRAQNKLEDAAGHAVAAQAMLELAANDTQALNALGRDA